MYNFYMANKPGIAGALERNVESVGVGAKREVGKVVESTVDQLGLHNWLYGPEKKLSEAEYKKLSAESKTKDIEAMNEARRNAGLPEQHAPIEEISKPPGLENKIGNLETQRLAGENTQTLGVKSQLFGRSNVSEIENPEITKKKNEKRMEAEHRETATTLGVRQGPTEDEQRAAREKQALNEKKEAQQKELPPLDDQAGAGKRKGLPGAKQVRSKMQQRIVQKAQTREETRVGQGFG